MAHNKNEGEYCSWQAVKAVVVHGKMKKKKVPAWATFSKRYPTNPDICSIKLSAICWLVNTWYGWEGWKNAHQMIYHPATSSLGDSKLQSDAHKFWTQHKYLFGGSEKLLDQYYPSHSIPVTKSVSHLKGT
jgi:hypothetical protein